MSTSELVSDNDSQEPRNTLENFNEIQFQNEDKVEFENEMAMQYYLGKVGGALGVLFIYIPKV